jgi:FkbM family methyltransferase
LRDFLPPPKNKNMTGTLADFWIDGAKRPKRWTERLDREWRRLTAPKRLTGAVIRGPGGAIALDLPDDPGIRYVLDEVLTRDCYPVVPGVASIATIVDIGANVGIAASRLRLAYPQARVLCFEPNPAALAYLRVNAPRARAELFEFGLGDADARLPLFQGTHSTVTASLSPRAMTLSEPLGAVDIRAADRALAQAGVSAIDLLKIDTEGAELPILKALAAFLTGVRIAHLEFHGEADRRAIESLFAPTHLLWSGTIEHGTSGQLTYLRRDLAP